jgi:hypothetical protein
VPDPSFYSFKEELVTMKISGDPYPYLSLFVNPLHIRYLRYNNGSPKVSLQFIRTLNYLVKKINRNSIRF